MKIYRMKKIIALLLLSCQLAGCGNRAQPQEAPGEEVEEQDVQETAGTPEPTPEPEEETLEEADLGDPEQEESAAEEPAEADAATEIRLSNTYVTKMKEINMISCPTFAFDYPESWEITEESYDASRNEVPEQVVLTAESGATILYMAHQPFGYYGSDMIRGEIVKIADSQFEPFYPEGTDQDLSSLAPFVVGEVRITGSLAMRLDDDYREVDAEAYRYYAVLPEKQLGEFTDIVGTGGLHDHLSFTYPSLYLFIAEPPEGDWTEQERAEAIAILSSFRVQ